MRRTMRLSRWRRCLEGSGSLSDSFTIKLEQVNGSGVSGELELRREGDASTRLTVRKLKGGPITGARVMS
jgi:hypothetical protein